MTKDVISGKARYVAASLIDQLLNIVLQSRKNIIKINVTGWFEGVDISTDCTSLSRKEGSDARAFHSDENASVGHNPLGISGPFVLF